MILKFVRRTITHLHCTHLIRNPMFPFSEDKRKGFGKYERKKVQDPKQQQPANDKSTQDTNINKTNHQHNNNRQDSIGQPQAGKQQKHKETTHPQKEQHNAQASEGVRASGFNKFGRINTPSQNKQQLTQDTTQTPRQPNNINHASHKDQGFGKFDIKRKTYSQDIPKAEGKSDQVQNYKQTKPQYKKFQQDIRQGQDPTKFELSGFSKFKKRNGNQPKSKSFQTGESKKDQQKLQLKNQKFQTQQANKQFQVSKHSDLQQKTKDFQKTQQSKSSFKPQQKDSNNTLNKQDLHSSKGFGFGKYYNRQKKSYNEENNNINILSTKKKQPKQKQIIKSKQQLQKQKQQNQLKQKQQFFKQKIHQFKRKKRLEEQRQELPKIYNILRRVERKIFQMTGIDLNAKIEPPIFIKSNPLLLVFFNLLSNMKLIALIGLVASLYAIYANLQQFIAEITPEEFLSYVQRGEANRIIFEEDQFDTDSQIGKKSKHHAIIMLNTGGKYRCVSNLQFEKVIRNSAENLAIINPHAAPLLFQNRKKQQSNFIGSLRGFLGVAMLYIFFSSIMGASKAGRKGGAGGRINLMEQSKSKRFQQKINVKFTDVVGMQKAKQQIVQFIDFLQNPQKYHRLGAKIPRGALLTGPPGTGKTMIAKACAGESKVPFFTISGSQFMEMYVGVGAQRVRDLFKQAKQASPSIIFIDQIDAVGKKRAAGFGGGNDERDNTLNQLLVEMDGFNTNSNVIVFAATNQKDVLDPALTRPGRFDRLIEVDLPDIEGRREIFMVHLRPIVIDSEKSMDEYAKRMATLTPGFSGADIKNLCNQAAIMAARNQNKFVTMLDFQLATERIIGGVEKKSHLITEETRRIVAYHECGHGVVSWFLEGANPLLKLTIIPRSKGSIGFAQYLPHQTQISTKKQLQDQICVILSGRVTEEVFFNKISTGAYDDLQKAYQIAHKIITQYGMNKKLGWLSFQQSEYAKHYSKETQKLIDEEILKIIKTCTDRSRQIVLQKKDLIEKLAKKLLQVETIDLSTISEILGHRQFKGNKQYDEYLKQHKKMVEENVRSASFKGDSTKYSEYIL